MTPKSTAYIGALERTWRIVAKSACALGIVLGAGGIAVAVIGHQAKTTIRILGTELSTTSVGVGLAFVGAVVFAIAIRRLLRSVDHATSADAMPEKKRGQ